MNLHPKPTVITILLVALCVGAVYVFSGFSNQIASSPEWGFFGHKRLNRLAVFTLPSEMLNLYKPSIEYLTEHAVDPDKRRYATRHEAVRHYIDIDEWGVFPFDNVPREFEAALMRYGEICGVTSRGDTISAKWHDTQEGLRLETKHKGLAKLRYVDFIEYFHNDIMPSYYDGPIFNCPELNQFFGDYTFASVFFIDRFSEHGILPYNLVAYQEKLTTAFTNKDVTRILRLSSEIGHYIGDAHVPLHTTTNYNGQLTDQVGIHAFWESRIPELFADDFYDYFVGQAELIEDIPTYYWDIVLASHALVDSVLLIEKRLSETFPADQQYCFEDRNNVNVSQPCEAYANAYSESMDGMVEERFRASIKAIGDAWYTAWFHAGRPDLSTLGKEISAVASDTIPRPKSKKATFGRQHWD